MDKKVLYALTSKIFSTLKKLGIKPKIGVTTEVKRLPGSKNSLNTDLSQLGETNPQSLKKLIANDADFLPQATPDEIAQFNNNLEYLQSTYPETFSKAEVVTEAKTGIKTLVDDVNEKLQGKKSMETVNPETGEVTVPKTPIRTASKNTTEVIEEEIIKNREPKAKGGLIKNLSYGKMFSDLDKTLDKGLGTMFKRKR